MLDIPINPDIEAKLKAKAEMAGVDLQTFVILALERAATRPSLDALLAPLHAEFEASGMSEDELVDLLETAKHEMRSIRRSSAS
jgi:hypothetical protein